MSGTRNITARAHLLAPVCVMSLVLASCASNGSKEDDAAANAANQNASKGNVKSEEMNVKVEGANATRDGDTLRIEYPVLADKNDRIPDWVINPSLGGVTGSIGVARASGFGTKEQLDEARLNARLELAAMLESRVQSVGRTELEGNVTASNGVSGEDSRKNELGIDRDIRDVVVAGTCQRALWFDPENGECYVWIVLDSTMLTAVDHYVVDEVSIFTANTPVTSVYKPERRKPVVPKVTIQAPEQPPQAPAPEPVPEAPKTPVEQLEGNLKPLETIPTAGGPEGAKKSDGS